MTEPSSSRPKRIWLSWSSGKDSAWSLHVLRQDPRVEVVGLLTTLNGENQRVAMHGVREQLLQAQAEAAGLPLHAIDLPFPCSNEQYAEKMEGALAEARRLEVSGMAFGDLYLEDIRKYRETQMSASGLELHFPLWGRPTRELAEEMIDGGLRAVLTCVDSRAISPSFAGRSYDRALLEELPTSADPCGENGEFHSFVHAGPMFSRSIEIEVGEVVDREGFVFADLRPKSMS